MKKNSKKALSPVVASIILIAVTVAVSVVVAAWLSGTAFSMMGNTEQVSVTNVQFTDGIAAGTPAVDSITVSLRNNGGAAVAINKVYINGNSILLSSLNGTTLTKGAISDVIITQNWDASTSYELKFTTTNGNNIQYTQVSPAIDELP